MPPTAHASVHQSSYQKVPSQASVDLFKGMPWERSCVAPGHLKPHALPDSYSILEQ